MRVSVTPPRPQLMHMLHKLAQNVGFTACSLFAGDARLTRKAEINRVNALCDQMELVKSQTRPQ